MSFQVLMADNSVVRVVAVNAVQAIDKVGSNVKGVREIKSSYMGV